MSPTEFLSLAPSRSDQMCCNDGVRCHAYENDSAERDALACWAWKLLSPGLTELSGLPKARLEPFLSYPAAFALLYPNYEGLGITD